MQEIEVLPAVLPAREAATVTVALILQIAELENSRDSKGPKWCGKSDRGVGALRQRLENPFAANVSSIIEGTVEGRAVAKSRDQARMLLASLCKSCGRCSLGK